MNAYTNAYLDYKTGEICLLFWDGDDRVAERINSRWHFYLTRDDYAEIDCPVFDEMIDDVEVDGKWARIYSSSRWDDRGKLVKWLRDRDVEPREADLSPVNRFLTDNPIKFDPHPRLLFYDLETDARAGFGDIPGHRVLSVAWKSGAGDDTEPVCLVAESNDDEGERKLLERFFNNIVGKHDVLVAWNGKKYDEVVLRARAKHHDLYPRWRMINSLDMMELFKHPYYGYGRDAEGKGVKVSWSLDNIGKTVLGRGKVDVMAEAERVLGYKPAGMANCIVDLHREAPDTLAAYNLRDVEVMAELEREKGYIETLTTLSHLCNRFLSDWSLFVGYLNDAFVLRYGAGQGIRFPTKQYAFTDVKMEKREKYTGAFVLEPEPGLFEGVTMVDFGALYPNVVDSFNISPETFVGMEGKVEVDKYSMCVAANGAVFRTDILGVFPAIIRMTKKGRAPHKKIMLELEEAGDEESAEFRNAKKYSQAWKLIGVGSYGVLGSPWLRHYSVECAEAVTLTGQAIEKMILDEARKRGINPLGADTDSGLLHCWEDRAVEFCGEMEEPVDDYVRERGGQPGMIRLDVSPSYERIVFTGKKHHAGIKTTGKIDVKGLELIRSDGCRYMREMQRRVLEYVLEAEDLDPAMADMVVKGWRDKLYAKEVDVEDLQITQGINKPLEAYKVDGVHVRVAKQMLADGKEIYEGQKIPYIVTKKRDGRQQGVHADDFDGQYDSQLYWDKVWPASRRVLEAAFPDWPWARLNKHDPAQRKMFDD